jgi:hypothetical protein
MDIREMGWKDMGWIAVTQDREKCQDVVNTVMNIWVP